MAVCSFGVEVEVGAVVGLIVFCGVALGLDVIKLVGAEEGLGAE